MRPLLFPAFFFFLLQSCSGPQKPGILKSSNLQSSFISLHNNQSYKLRTPKGAVLHIPAGAFDTKNNNVQLELKEAYSMSDIVLGGLSTRSNGQLLKSGGMLYINAKAEGKDIGLTKSIGITIPAATYDEGMQLFKGEVQSDSMINWVDPQPLDTSPYLTKGEMLFKANCASCHKVTKDFTGPALAGVTHRVSREWISRFTRNPAVMAERDPYSIALAKKWRPTIMTSFPSLTRDDINAIKDYTKKQALLAGFNTAGPEISDSEYVAAFTDCGSDTIRYRKEWADFTPMPSEDAAAFIEQDTIPLEPAMPEMYRFIIDKFGWYNIDQFLANGKTLTSVSLDAMAEEIPGVNVSVYLSIPDEKLLTPGNKNDNGLYVFDEGYGQVNLPLNSKAFILAEGRDASGKFYYGISHFTIQKKQAIRVHLKPSDEKQLFDSLEAGRLEGIPLNAEKHEIRIEKRDCDDWPRDSIRRTAAIFNRK